MEVIVNCNVPNCDGKHNIVFINDKAIISVKEFFKIVHHWEKNVKKICGKTCQAEIFCRPHKLLNLVQLFRNNIVEKNMTSHIVVSEMQIIKDCEHNICMSNWCFDIYKKALNTVLAMQKNYINCNYFVSEKGHYFF